MSNMPQMLPDEVVDVILEHIMSLGDIIDDEPLGRRIFDIIENRCIVVYYPIIDAEEKNDGFWISGIPLQNGNDKDIIFINTYQTEEKQVFAAAHEFGHHTKVAEYVLSKGFQGINPEDIVNRFAAELLMPKKLFRSLFLTEIRPKLNEEHKTSRLNMIETVVSMMNRFSVPYNAVVIRLVETGIIRNEDGKMLVDGNDSISLEDIKKQTEEIITTGEYENLKASSRKREIRGLDQLLNIAEKDHLESKAKIDRLREAFGIIKNKEAIMEKEIGFLGEQ